MPSPSYSQNKASIQRYRASHTDKCNEICKLSMRRKRAYQSGVKQLFFILNNFFDN
jgi:hypothetical protein